MSPRHLLLTVLLIGLGACSALRPDISLDQDAEHRLERGLAALDAGRYGEAFGDLSWVYTHCPGRARGIEALVALSGLELDPRNEAGRPGVATDLLGRLLREPGAPGYVRPMATSSYLMALALGAPPAPADPNLAAPGGTTEGMPAPAEPDTVVPVTPAARPDTPAVRIVRAEHVLDEPAAEPAHGCGAPITVEGWVTPRLPELPGPSLVALLEQAERARASTAAEASTLRAELEAARQRLAETEAELERIRKTLKP